MPLNTDLNVSPYFDDFNEDKNFHRILFKPATAVQARELTQIQSILQNQIERFGNWAFNNGDIVSGCSIVDIPVLPFVRLEDFQTNTAGFNVSDLVNTKAVSLSSNLQARVLTSVSGNKTNYPNTNIIYVQYLNAGNTGQQSFSNTDQITFYKIQGVGNTSNVVAVVNVYSNSTTGTLSTGNAHGVSVSEGIVFLNGNFVKVHNPTFGIVNAYGTNAGNNVVGFQAIETLINSNDDDSLLDNALGYSNENAPGADRLQILPALVSLAPETAANTKDFNPIITYNYGAVLSKAGQTQNVYSILGDAVANRTYEESGNYVVNPFVIDTVTAVSSNSILSNLDANNVLGRIGPGVGYAQGQRVEVVKTGYINLRRGIDTQINAEQQMSFSYGGYFICNEVAGSFDFPKSQTVQLYDTPQQSITNRTFAALTPTGNNIGTAMVRCYSYKTGNPGSNTAQYILHVFNVSLSAGYNAANIKSVYYNGTTKGVADVISPGTVASQVKKQIYSFGVQGIKNLRDAGNNIRTQYTYRNRTSASLSPTGNVVVTIATSQPGGTDILPYGVGIVSDAQATSFTLVASANADTAALTGTANVSSTTAVVRGNSTTFTSNFLIGDQIKIASDIRTITGITNATYMSIDSPFSVTNTAATYYKTYVNGKIIPIAYNIAGPSSYINVTNTTSFTIAAGQYPASTLTVDVVYDVLRTVASPATKTIKKNRFVKIDVGNNAAGPKGPWCLGISDVHKVTKIYATGNGFYTTSGSDVTSNFTWSSGQKDTHYDYGYLYAKPGYDATQANNLLIQLDYLSSNTSSGVGFFTVESYPIDDANTANTNAITTANIPLYIDDSGVKNPLRDSIDFRTPSTPTAADSGVVDIANTSQVTTAVAAATINPLSTLTLTVPTNGLNFPSYGKNFQADFTQYLPRRDLVLITADNKIKVKEGVSGISPQTPLYPDNAMALAIINMPPYPSLSSDQVDSLLPINQSSTSLARDTSTAISSTVVANRRYTMRDIGKLDQRITNLEYYTQLSLLEKAAKDLTVTDANGLDRFKNGIFVEPFSDFSTSDVSNPEFNMAIDSSKGIGRPRIIREIINIDFNQSSSTNAQKTGRVVTLPYTEVAFLSQPYATKYRNSALVAYAWNGSMILLPSYDNHGDTINTGSVNITIDNSKPWQDFANSPFGYTWGDWRTTVTADVSTVISGKVENIQLNLGDIGLFTGGNRVNDAGAAAIALAAQQAGVDPNVIRGHLSLSYGGQIYQF